MSKCSNCKKTRKIEKFEIKPKRNGWTIQVRFSNCDRENYVAYNLDEVNDLLKNFVPEEE